MYKGFMGIDFAFVSSNFQLDFGTVLTKSGIFCFLFYSSPKKNGGTHSISMSNGLAFANL